MTIRLNLNKDNNSKKKKQEKKLKKKKNKSADEILEEVQKTKKSQPELVEEENNDEKEKKNDDTDDQNDEKDSDSKETEECEVNESKDNEIEENIKVDKNFVYFVDLDEDINEIASKIKSTNQRRIYLFIPSDCKLFHSPINIQILQKCCAVDKKYLYIVSTDKKAKFICKKLGINFIDDFSNDYPSLIRIEDENDKLNVTPLKATLNSLDKESPTRLAEKKISIAQILEKKTKSLKRTKIGSKITVKKKKQKSKKLIINGGNRHSLIGLVIISLFVLLVIAYIALPGATVYLTPAASVVEKSINITLLDETKNASTLSTRPEKVIASNPASVTSEDGFEGKATGKRASSESNNASGLITIYNESSQAWPLVENTRFQTEDGIVFRISRGITVPAATSEGPGMTQTIVIADVLDAFGNTVGDRGNIEPSSFILPGLDESLQTTVYAKSEEKFTGGISEFETFISEEDIEAAKIELEKILKERAKRDLILEVESLNVNSQNEVNYELLEGDEAIKFSDVEFEYDESLIGSNSETFLIRGSVSASGVYYDKNFMENLLREELLLVRSENKELLEINEESSSYRIFEWDDAAGRIRVTANIKGIEQYEIDPSTKTGEEILAKISSQIAGVSVNEAETYIRNLPEVNTVTIENWPFWAPNIPSIEDNIDFEVREAIVVNTD